MLTKRIRLILIFVLFAGGIVALFSDPYLAIVLWAVSLVLILGHLRHGSMIGVLRALGQGRSDKAERLLAEISRPDLLSRRYRAYYHFARGLLATQRKEHETVKVAFNKALEIGLKGRQERAVSYLSLARVAYTEKDRENAKNYLEKTKENQTKDLFLKRRIEELEAALKR